MIKKFIYTFLNTVTHKIFQFKGRSGRKEYFIYTFFEMLIFVPYTIWLRYYTIEPTLINVIALIFCFVLVFIHIIASTSLSIRRLHDFNFKGWWFLLGLLFLPVVNLTLYFIRGNKDTNRYGEPPKD